MEKEIWEDIPNYEGYYKASSTGRIKSIAREICRSDGVILPIKERIMKQRINRNGYYIVELSKSGNTKTFEVHVLIASAFIGYKSKRDSGMVCDHIDNNSRNNRAENLQIITRRENSTKDQKGNTSQFIGVFWCNTYNKWASRIRHNGKQKHIGYYKCEINAAKAYQEELEKIERLIKIN